MTQKKAGLPPAEKIHAVTNLAHEFTFYADNRFHRQYLPDQKGVTNWSNLYNFDFSNANLLILPGCDNRISYSEKDVAAIRNFLDSGGGVVVMGSEGSHSQNVLLGHFGAGFRAAAQHPLIPVPGLGQDQIEGLGGAFLELEQPPRWEVLISDSHHQAVMARRRVGKGTLLVASRSLAGSNPNASDSINRDIWRPLLAGIAAGKKVNPAAPFEGAGINRLEHTEDHGTFSLSYTDYLKPFAQAMAAVYTRSLPHIEARMGVPLSPGMASEVVLLATGGGGFSSGTVVALAVWWGGFPDREDSMIEFLTHEAVHSWVLPFPEVWNEPIATYLGNLVMIDMGYEQEALRRIQHTINRAARFDPEMKLYDIDGSSGDQARALNKQESNEIHWGKTYWIFEQLRAENPDIIADYFSLKRQHATPENISRYDIHNTVVLLSMAMGRDLFGWFNQHGIRADKNRAGIDLVLN